jgi:Overcoming lysogenization defect protein-like, TOPRIM domain
MTRAEAVVLVEGASDRNAVEAMAERLGRDLAAEGVSVVPMGGASALGAALDDLRNAQGFEGKLAGLCDEGEVGDFRRGLERAGFGDNLSRSDMEALGFYVCVLDLEDELIRALGVAVVEEVLERHGDLGSFHTLQRQPAWRGRPADEQLRRFFGAGARRKVRYGRYLVEALDMDRVPRPLEQVLGHV